MEISNLTNDDLKKELRLNDQKVSGAKKELVDRVVDGRLYGALPQCGDCGGGKLRVKYASKFGHKGQGQFSCPGYFDDTKPVRCSFKSDHVARIPWKLQE